eukprot:403911-Amphidinium_carterae.1
MAWGALYGPLTRGTSAHKGGTLGGETQGKAGEPKVAVRHNLNKTVWPTVRDCPTHTVATITIT